jgi:hypothetical protein
VGTDGDDDPRAADRPAAPLAYDTTRALGPAGEAAVRARSASGEGARSAAGEPPARAIGRYQLGALLGQGGMGVVYRARDPELDRALAIKLVRAGGGEPGHARVLREAQAMARLRHPNVVPVFDVGVHDGAVYLVMPLLEGGTLGGWLRGGRRPWRDVVDRFLAAARGLAAAHAVGIVHRDFKPDNVLLGRGDEVQVADFGLARAAGGAAGEDVRAELAASPLAAEVTDAGTVLGTPAYMAPEQLDGAPVDGRADQFGFCVALFEALHGRRPFEARADATTDLITLREAIHRGPASVRVDGDAPRWLRAIVARGLREDPAARWPSMDALGAAIEARRRRPRRIAIGALAGVGVVGAAAVALVAAGVGRGGGPNGPGYRIDRAARITFGGCAAQPAFAPDGARIAYVKRRGSEATIALEELAAGGGERVLGPGDEPAFSPDGHRLAALAGGQVVVHDLARPDEPPRVLGPSSSGPSWLGDDELVVGVGDRLLARPLAGGADRLLGRVPDGHVLRATAVGADRRVLVIHRADAGLAEAVVAELRPDGSTRELRRGVLSTAGVHYDAARRVFRYVQRRNSGQYQLFVQAMDGGVPMPVATEQTPAGGFDVAADRGRLALSTCAEAARIVSVARDGSLADVTSPGGWRDNAPVPLDERRLVHTSSRSGQVQLWLLDRVTGDDRPLVPRESSQPAISPDGATLVYSQVTGDGRLALRLAPIAAPGSPRELTDGHVDRAARFTRDGATIVFLRETGAGLVLHRVPAVGGLVTPLGPTLVARAFDVAPDGGGVVYAAPGDLRSPLWQVALDGASPRRVDGSEQLGGAVRAVRFAPDGRRLLAVDGDRRLLELTLATGEVTTRWQVDGSEFSAIGQAAYDTDGARILVSLTSRAGDLWVVDGSF